MSENFYVKFSFSGPVVLEKILKIFFLVDLNLYKTVSSIMAPPDP
jgi:hypothetical protein